jgi:hypothetical protein
VNGVVNKGGLNKTRDDLTCKLKKDTANQFSVGKANMQEHHRVLWTTQYNLTVWYDNWLDVLIELGFARLIKPEETGVVGEVFSNQVLLIGSSTSMKQMGALTRLLAKEAGVRLWSLQRQTLLELARQQQTKVDTLPQSYVA